MSTSGSSSAGGSQRKSRGRASVGSSSSASSSAGSSRRPFGRRLPGIHDHEDETLRTFGYSPGSLRSRGRASPAVDRDDVYDIVAIARRRREDNEAKAHLDDDSTQRHAYRIAELARILGEIYEICAVNNWDTPKKTVRGTFNLLRSHLRRHNYYGNIPRTPAKFSPKVHAARARVSRAQSDRRPAARPNPYAGLGDSSPPSDGGGEEADERDDEYYNPRALFE